MAESNVRHLCEAPQLVPGATVIALPNAAADAPPRRRWHGRYPVGVLSMNVERNRRRRLMWELDEYAKKVAGLAELVDSLNESLWSAAQRLQDARAKRCELTRLLRGEG